MKRLIAPFLVLVLAAPLSAMAAATTTLYDIEVLVFENREPGLEGGETWKETRKELADLAQAAVPEGTPAPDSVLSQAAAALERNGAHKVLVHKHWQQSADAKSATTPLRLESANHDLDGTLRFYLSRFLHVELNLALQEGRGGKVVYSLSEHRRVRPQEVHYFDHPKLGALVYVAAVGKPDKPKPVRRLKSSR